MLKDNKIFNIRPAERLESVAEYYFSTKREEIERMKDEGKNIISLGIGSPDLPPSEKIIETFCNEIKKPDTHGYQPYTGIGELREAYAKWYKKWYHVDLDPQKEIQPLIGSKEGVLHISLAFLNPGDGVLIPDPGYPTYSSVSKLIGAEVIHYDLKEEHNWQPDFEALEKLDLSHVKLMWINYPHMPTGAQADRALLEKIVDFGRRNNIVICNDNPYSFILNDDLLSILSIPGAKDVCIELNSLSKSHNMPGWRMAMVASNPQFIQWILKVKSNIDSGQFKPMMLAAVEALRASKSWYDYINKVYAERRVVAEEIMLAIGCRFDKNQKGMFLWGKIPDQEKNGEATADRLLNEAHIFLTPGFIFGKNGDRYIRISLCCKKEQLEEALTRINHINHNFRHAI